MTQDGGGASRSTDPASGSSAATDVSLREYIVAQLASLDRHTSAQLEALRRESRTANIQAEKAVQIAQEASSERLAAHNGLIEQMREQAQFFASRESLDDFKEATDKRLGRIERFQATLTGGMMLVVFIGAANLVKVWSG